MRLSEKSLFCHFKIPLTKFQLPDNKLIIILAILHFILTNNFKQPPINITFLQNKEEINYR